LGRLKILPLALCGLEPKSSRKERSIGFGPFGVLPDGEAITLSALINKHWTFRLDRSSMLKQLKIKALFSHGQISVD